MTPLYTIKSFDGELIMIAPISTIQHIYGLHHSAITRISLETKSGGECKCFGNGRHADFIISAHDQR